jgi:peptide/nickel transport system substrate-binding protein
MAKKTQMIVFMMMGWICFSLAFSSVPAKAENLKPVPEIDFLTWVPAKFMAYYETSNYIAQEWEKLGLKVNLRPTNFPNPLLTEWFKEHKFDCVVSVLSGSPDRMEPDFFTNSQFNSKHMDPGNWNVGEWENETFDKIGEKQLEIYDPQKRRELIYKLQAILKKEQPETVVNYPIENMGINTTNMELDYVDAPDGLRSIWNQIRFTPKKDVKFLKVGRISDQATWNPLAAIQSDDFEMLRMVYDRLVQVGPQGDVQMWAAKSVLPVDQLTFEVELRKDLQFSDGKPLTAEDVKFSYEFMKKWESAFFLKYLAPIKDIKIVNNYKLNFILHKPFAPFIMNTLGQIFILPKHVWVDVVKEKGLTKPQDFPNIPVIGSGPFVMEYWKEAEEFMLRANRKHFTAPKADLLFIVFGTREFVNAALKKGYIDINIQSLPPAAVKEFKSEKDIKLFEVKTNGYSAVRYNTSKTVFMHTAIRQACSYAVPYKRIVDEIYDGYAGLSSSSITPVNSFWHNNELEAPEYNLEKARQILTDAGFLWDKDGRLCFPRE